MAQRLFPSLPWSYRNQALIEKGSLFTSRKARLEETNSVIAMTLPGPLKDFQKLTPLESRKECVLVSK